MMIGCQALENWFITASRRAAKKIAAILSLAAICVAHGSAAAHASDTGKVTFKIDQSSYFVGRADTFINDHAIRVNFGSEKIFLVASAPTWRVVLYNAEKKLGLAFSYDEWLQRHPVWSNALDHDWIPRAALLPVGTSRIYGLPVRTYKFGERVNGKVIVKTNGQQATMAYADSNSVSEKGCHILQRAFCVPQMQGLPLTLTFHSQERKIEGMKRGLGGSQHMLKTISLEPLTPAGSKFDYSYPRSFKRVMRESELMRTSDGDENVKQFMEILQ
jgi:hypothetical protein